MLRGEEGGKMNIWGSLEDLLKFFFPSILNLSLFMWPEDNSDSDWMSNSSLHFLPHPCTIYYYYCGYFKPPSIWIFESILFIVWSTVCERINILFYILMYMDLFSVIFSIFERKTVLSKSDQQCEHFISLYVVSHQTIYTREEKWRSFQTWYVIVTDAEILLLSSKSEVSILSHKFFLCPCYTLFWLSLMNTLPLIKHLGVSMSLWVYACEWKCLFKTYSFDAGDETSNNTPCTITLDVFYKTLLYIKAVNVGISLWMEMCCGCTDKYGSRNFHFSHRSRNTQNLPRFLWK